MLLFFSQQAWYWVGLWSEPACGLGCSPLWAWLWCVACHTGPFGAQGHSPRGVNVWSMGVARSSWIWPSAGTVSRWLSVPVLHTALAACTFSMFSQAGSCATGAEHHCGLSALSEFCIVLIFQHAKARLVVFGLCFFSCFLQLVWDTCWPWIAN